MLFPASSTTSQLMTPDTSEDGDNVSAITNDLAQVSLPTLEYKAYDDKELGKLAANASITSIDTLLFGVKAILCSVDVLQSMECARTVAEILDDWTVPVQDRKNAFDKYGALKMLIISTASSALFCEEQDIIARIPSSSRSMVVSAWQRVLARTYRRSPTNTLHSSLKAISRPHFVSQEQRDLDADERLAFITNLHRRQSVHLAVIVQALHEYRCVAAYCSAGYHSETTVASIIRGLVAKYHGHLLQEFPADASLATIDHYLFNCQPAIWFCTMKRRKRSSQK